METQISHEEASRILASELQKLGIDISTEEGRSVFRANMKWAQKNRERCERSSTYALMIVIGGVITALMGAILDVIEKWFK